MAKGKIVQKPAGPSERKWNNQSSSSDRDVLCEVCGTNASEDQSSIIDRFLGLQLVEECCGRLIDRLFEEFGEEFCLAFLEEFTENPTDPRFIILKMALKEMPNKLQEKSKEIIETSEAIEKISDEAPE